MKTDLLKQTEIFIFLALVFSIFLIAIYIEKNKLTTNYENEIGAWNTRIADVSKDANGKESVYSNNEKKYKAEIKGLKNEINRLNGILETQNENPPYINLDKETTKYFFKSGSAKVSNEFRRFLSSTIANQLIELLELYPKCNAIYIIGHTDHQRVNRSTNNSAIDLNVVNQLSNNCNIDLISYNSNVDLGLLRASAIYCVLRENSILNRKIKYWYPYSAGAIVDEKTKRIVSKIDYKDNESKRRIEIRMYAI